MEVYAYGNAAGAFLKLAMTNHAVSFVYFPQSLVNGGVLTTNNQRAWLKVFYFDIDFVVVNFSVCQ